MFGSVNVFIDYLQIAWPWLLICLGSLRNASQYKAFENYKTVYIVVFISYFATSIHVILLNI